MFEHEITINYGGNDEFEGVLNLSLSYDHWSDEYEVMFITLDGKAMTDSKLVEIIGESYWKQIQDDAIDSARLDAENNDRGYEDARDNMY
jgi:hypothetical protein